MAKPKSSKAAAPCPNGRDDFARDNLQIREARVVEVRKIPPLPGIEFAARITVEPSPTIIGDARSSLINALRGEIEREKVSPSLVELHKQLEAIEKAAHLLRRTFSNLRIMPLLFGDAWSRGKLENENETYHLLGDIGARAVKVRAANPRKRGRKKLYPEGPTTRELCALMVVALDYQEWPPMSDLLAQQRCEALWRDAGGRHAGLPRAPSSKKHRSKLKKIRAAGDEVPNNWGKDGADSVEVWRKCLASAKKYKDGPHSQLIKKILSFARPEAK